MNSKFYNYCISLLSKRDYSTQKITQKLCAKGLESDEIREILQKLTKENFLNPQRYLEQRIENLSKKGFSVDYIQQKLHSEEILLSKESIINTQENCNIYENTIIKDLLAKKITEYINKKSTLSSIQLKSKAMMFLSSKGYDFYQAEDLLPIELSEEFN